ncbi:MAG: septum formation initiator family protein [Chloroflexota bacterium]
MNKKRPGSKVPVAQFVAIVALSISIFLIVDLARRAAANYRVQREAYRLEQEVKAVRDYQARLLARRTYVASDLYVEEVARNELKWARPGETVIVVMPTPEAAAASLPVTAADEAGGPATVQTPRQAWQQLFFGDRLALTSSATP